MTTAEASTSEIFQMRFLGIVWKVALLLLYALTFASMTLFVFWRLHVMVALATAIGSVAGWVRPLFRSFGNTCVCGPSGLLPDGGGIG